MAAVEREQREHVEHAHEHVEHGEQVQDADDAFGPADVVAHRRDADERGRPRLEIVVRAGDVGDDVDRVEHLDRTLGHLP
jgi:hypothetical protein